VGTWQSYRAYAQAALHAMLEAIAERVASEELRHERVNKAFRNDLEI
jgi:hypothetical protein